MLRYAEEKKMMRAPDILSEEEKRILDAATDRILPGASEANALSFIEGVIRQPHFRVTRQRLVSGLALLRDLSLDMYGKNFVACNPVEQDEVLKRIQSIPHPITQRFFKSLVNLTLAGFLSDPSHGGNRDAVGWRYIGFEPHTSASIPGVEQI